jgi:4-aminobutyrate aminotransferase/(S)-3-amino-2-methylpropionate transaminase
MTSIVLKTAIPGPLGRAAMERMDQHVTKAKVDKALVPSVIQHGEGALVTDIDGNVLIDLVGGVGSMNVGHSHPKVVKAIQTAAAKFQHTDFTVVPYESYIDLAEQLCARAPGNWHKKACFLNSGAEAVESAIKIAKKATGRTGVICFSGAFHGRTLMALTLTSRILPYKEGMGPFAPEVYRAPYPYTYRWPGFDDDEERTAAEAIAQLRQMFTTHVSPRETAALIIEPIQGEAGFIVPPQSYMDELQKLCREYGIVLIADEVQTGIGRTGYFYASEYFGFEPDLITVGKSVGGGLPLSGVIGRAELMDVAGDGSIGGTFVGNPIACEAALAVLDIIEEEKLLERAVAIGDILRARLEQMNQTSALIGEIRGVGAMVAFELVKNKATREPASEEVTAILKKALERGVILIKAGVYGNIIRFLLPLVITDAQLHEALDVLALSLAEVEAESGILAT